MNTFSYGKQLQSSLIDTTFNDYLRTNDNDPLAEKKLFTYGDSDMWMFHNKKPIALFEIKHHREFSNNPLSAATSSMQESYHVAGNRPFFLAITYTKNDNDPLSKDFGKSDTAQCRPVIRDDPYVYVIPVNSSSKLVFDNFKFTVPNEPGRWFKKREFTQLGLAILNKPTGDLHVYLRDSGAVKQFTELVDEDSIAKMIAGTAY